MDRWQRKAINLAKQVTKLRALLKRKDAELEQVKNQKIGEVIQKLQAEVGSQ